MLSLFMAFFDSLLDYFIEIFTKLDNVDNSQQIIKKVPKPPRGFRDLEIDFN